jgi:hypothetical protein
MDEIRKILIDFEHDSGKVKKHYKLDKTPDWLLDKYKQELSALCSRVCPKCHGKGKKPE